MPNPSHPDRLQSASTHHRSGHLRQAEEAYRQILLENPDSPEALHGVGLLAMQSPRPDLAAAYLARAAQIAPSVAIYHHNLGEAWMLAGDLNQAAACLRRAIWIEPARPETHAVLGVALSRLQRFQPAVESLQQAIHLGADRPEADKVWSRDVARWREALRFHVPLIEPDVRICRIRLSEKKVMLSPTGGSLYARAIGAVQVAGLRRY